MKRKTTRFFILATAIASLLFAAVILVWGEGLRRWYSGGFFALIGIIMLINARRWRTR